MMAEMQKVEVAKGAFTERAFLFFQNRLRFLCAQYSFKSESKVRPLLHSNALTACGSQKRSFFYDFTKDNGITKKINQ